MSNFPHTVGSHSDDRGGDSDLPCYCDSNDPKPTPTPRNDELREIMDDMKLNYRLSSNVHGLDEAILGAEKSIKSLISAEKKKLLDRLLERKQYYPKKSVSNEDTFIVGVPVDVIKAEREQL